MKLEKCLGIPNKWNLLVGHKSVVALKIKHLRSRLHFTFYHMMNSIFNAKI